jgi:FolB domain-containing protein
LEVFYRVGVPDEERANSQRLLLSIELEHDFAPAAKSDSIEATIDYNHLAQRLAAFGANREWKLIESLAVDLADIILNEYKPAQVTVEVKKFILPQTKWVAVRVRRPI